MLGHKPTDRFHRITYKHMCVFLCERVFVCVCVILTTWHGGRCLGSVLDAITISRRSSWAALMVLWSPEERSQRFMSGSRKQRFMLRAEEAEEGRGNGRTCCMTGWPMTELFMPRDEGTFLWYCLCTTICDTAAADLTRKPWPSKWQQIISITWFDCWLLSNYCLKKKAFVSHR